jgi:hypothetical protein
MTPSYDEELERVLGLTHGGYVSAYAQGYEILRRGTQAKQAG